MRHIIRALMVTVSLLTLYGAAPSTSFSVTVTDPTVADPTVATNWLAQKVCITGSGTEDAVDPYSSSNPWGDKCPAGDTMRNMKESDTVPYYKVYNPITPGGAACTTRCRYTGAYEATLADGTTSYVMYRQFQPSNVPSNWYVNQSFYPGSSQWDMYEVNNGYVANDTTRDNTGMQQTFWGNVGGTSIPHTGWIDFPISFTSNITNSPAPASTFVPISGEYWEQDGQTWPNPTHNVGTSNPDTQTTWKLLTGYTFDSGKVMNTIESIHQSGPVVNTTNPDQGHIEAWFFTVPYGATRWEVWSAASCLAPGGSCTSYIQSNCNNATDTQTFPYKGTNYTYYRTNCVDWEEQGSIATAGSTNPTMPVPQANLLTNFHFSNDAAGTVGSASGWTIGGNLTLTQLQSTAAGDTGNGQRAGVRYVRISCSSACSSASALSQTYPTGSGGTYSFGAEAETESGTGSVSVTLSQVDSGGNVLGTPSTFTQSITNTGDGSNCSSLPRVENCAIYIGGRTSVTLQPTAVGLKISVQPTSSSITYDVTDVYLGRAR